MRQTIAIFLLVALLMATVLPLYAAVLFSDDFNRADGAVGANWTSISGTWTISSNQLRQTATSDSFLLYSGTAGVNDYYVQSAIGTPASGTISILGRMTGSTLGTVTGYMATRRLSAAQVQLYKITAGPSYTAFVTVAETWTAGDTLRLEMVGTSLKVYHCAPTCTTPLIDTTDSTFSAGGTVGYRVTDGEVVGDTFEIGTLGGATRVSRRVTN